MTTRDDSNDPFDSDDDFENFLSDLAGSVSPAEPIAVKANVVAPVKVASSSESARPESTQHHNVDRDIDFDEDGATRIGEIPSELLLALGRKEPSRPASDVRPTDRPPMAAPDETEVELDAFDDVHLESLTSLAPPIGTQESNTDDGLVGDPYERTTLVFDEPAPAATPPSTSANNATTVAPASSSTAARPVRDSAPAAPTAPAATEDYVEIDASAGEIVMDGDDTEIVVDGDDDDDDVAIDTGEAEIVLDGDDDGYDDAPRGASPRQTGVPSIPGAPVTPIAAPPILTLTGKALVVARAQMLADLAAGASGDAATELRIAAAELGDRAGLGDTDTWLETAATNSAMARRVLARRGRRSVRALTTDSLGADVAAFDAILDAVVLARSEESSLATLERATNIARSTHLRRMAATAAASLAERAGDTARAATLRVSTLSDDQPTSSSITAARNLVGLRSLEGASLALGHAARAASKPDVASAIRRWASLFGAPTALDHEETSIAGADTLLDRLAGGDSPEARAESERTHLTIATLGEADDRANALANAAHWAAVRGDLETARTRFDDARRMASRSAFIDALRDATATRSADATRLPPTPVHDDDDAPLAALGLACVAAQVDDATWAALVDVRGRPRAASTVDLLSADVAANLGVPTEWVDALARERRGAVVGGSGVDVARAVVFARAGDRPGALEALAENPSDLAITTRAILGGEQGCDTAMWNKHDVRSENPHDTASRTRLDRATDVAVLMQAQRSLGSDGIIARRLEQAARRDGIRPAEVAALAKLADLADDETDRTKFRLLAGSSDSDGQSTLDLAPDDPVLLAEALVGASISPATRERALTILSNGASPIAEATLRARASSILELDGSTSDAAAELRRAHEVVPNEPSLAFSLDLAELAAAQYVRVAHRLFAIARSEADAATRARALSRLAELDRRENGDASAALASLQAVFELAPLHVPTLRGIESISRDRGDDALYAPIEAALASALADGRSADAHARLAIRYAIAQAPVPAVDARPIAFQALRRGTQSSRLLRWVEHGARGQNEPLEFDSLDRRITNADTDAARIELLARVAAYAERRRDPRRARQALDRAFDLDRAHPTIALERASAYDSSDDHAKAASAHDAAAAVCVSDDRAAGHLLRAAHHHELAGDRVAAREALDRASVRAPNNVDALAQLADALERWGDHAGALDALERRVTLGGSSNDVLPAHRTRADIAERLGRTQVAQAAFVDILAIAPEDSGILARAAALAIKAADGRTAVDMLIRLARLEKNPAELARIFRELGNAYENLTPDPRRAEASYRRVVQLEAHDSTANERLTRLLAAQGRFDDALAIVEAYDSAAPSTVLARTLRFEIARALEASGDARRAEALLEAVRREASTNTSVVFEMAQFYERQGARPALSMHLSRAAADLRRAFEDAPSEDALTGLLEVHRLRGREDAFACTAATAAALGIGHASNGQPLTDHVPGAGRRANEPELDDLVAPRALPVGTRAALRLAGDAIDKAFPFDPRPFKTEKLGKDSPIRAEAMRVAEWFGFDDVVILVTAAAPRICVPVGSHPFTIVMGRELPIITTELEREFLFVRAAKTAAAGLSFAMRLQGPQVAQAVFALVRSRDDTYEPAGVDLATLTEPARIIAKHTSSSGDLGALCLEMGSRANFEPHRFGIAAAQWSDRVALVATGQTRAGMAALLRLGGNDLESASGFDARLALVRSMPEAFGLLAFSLSDAHAEARVRAGISRG